MFMRSMFCTSRALAQMLHEPAEGSGFQLRHQRVVDLGHGPTSIPVQSVCAAWAAPAAIPRGALRRDVVAQDRPRQCGRGGAPRPPGQPASRIRSWRISIRALTSPRSVAVLPQAVALELAGVGLVVADDQVALGVEAPRAGAWRAAGPGPTARRRARAAGVSFQLSVKEWIDSSMGGTPAGQAPVDDGVDGAVIGRVIEADAPLALGVVEVAVAGDDGAVGQAHDERGVVGAAVGVDQQPRVARQHAPGRPVRPRARASRCGGADVVGDVALQLLGGQPQGAVAGRNGVAGVVAEQDQACVGTARAGRNSSSSSARRDPRSP